MATFPQCRTCKWWGVLYVGVCDRVNIPTPLEGRFDVEVSAADDTDVQALLYTGPEFGCVLHEEGRA